MSDLRQVEFAEKDRPLRSDVSLLGQLLGQVLVDQHGESFLRQVESVRQAAIRMREGGGDPRLLEQALAELSTEDIDRLVKAFSTYLRLANLAEKVHRIRRRRDYLRADDVAQVGSLRKVIGDLHRQGVARETIARSLEEMRLRPVFTAHPTEATRRTLLEKEFSIVQRLVERLNPELTPQEGQQALDRIRDAITSAWQTSPVPSVRPRVADELDNVLFYLTEILYRVTPPFQESLQAAFEEHYGTMTSGPDTGQCLRFGSWVGGDMDGNPNVNATTLLESLATQRAAIIARYLPDLRRLGRYLSQTRGDAGFTPALEQRLAQYHQLFPEVAQAIPERHRDMPYRCLLRFMTSRLEATSREGTGAFPGSGELLQDLQLINASLEANRGRYAGLFGLRRLQQRVETFGFHLATLDTRQDAMVHREVVAELLARPGWIGEAAGARTRALTALLGSDPLGVQAESDQARSTLSVFRAIAEARARFGEDAIGLYIISMAQGADDVLSALFLAREAGLGDARGVALDVAPLLETVQDLVAGPGMLDELLNLPVYRSHLARRGDQQVIMVGYSDSNKDGGIVSARWNLFEAQARLRDIGLRHGIAVRFFHGRGGTVSRGGGNLVAGIEGAPPDTVGGFLRITEQGEVINQKYGVRPIALRNLELASGAMLRHQLTDTGQHASEDMRRVMGDLADVARRNYRDMVFESPGFVGYFRQATPIDVIERLNIGSRPASRRSGQGIENLRAIPWVFSWAQVRVGFPGVYGIGSALEHAAERHGIACLRDMLRYWSFFRGLVNDVEMVLAKSVLDIGARYAALADTESRHFHARISAEFDKATRMILEIKQHRELLTDHHTLQRTIRLRNPYVDPLHLLQIDLLQRWRAGGRESEDLLRALKSTVNGIALAIQNTG